MIRVCSSRRQGEVNHARSGKHFFPCVVYDPYVRLLIEKKDISTIGLTLFSSYSSISRVLSADLDISNESGPLRDPLRQPEPESLKEGTGKSSIFKANIRDHYLGHVKSTDGRQWLEVSKR